MVLINTKLLKVASKSIHVSEEVLSEMDQPNWNHKTVMKLLLNCGTRLDEDNLSVVLACFHNFELVSRGWHVNPKNSKVLFREFHAEMSKVYNDELTVKGLEKKALKYARSKSILAELKKFINLLIPTWCDPGKDIGFLENLPLVFSERLQRTWLGKYYHEPRELLDKLNRPQIQKLYFERCGLSGIPKENFFRIPDTEYLYKKGSKVHLNAHVVLNLVEKGIKMILILTGCSKGKTYGLAELILELSEMEMQTLYLNSRAVGVQTFVEHVEKARTRNGIPNTGKYRVQHYKNDLSYRDPKTGLVINEKFTSGNIASNICSIGRMERSEDGKLLYKPDFITEDEAGSESQNWDSPFLFKKHGYRKAYRNLEEGMENAKCTLLCEGTPTVRILKRIEHLKGNEVAVFYNETQNLERFGAKAVVMVAEKPEEKTAVREAWTTVFRKKVEKGKKSMMCSSLKRLVKSLEVNECSDIPSTSIHADLGAHERLVREPNKRFAKDLVTSSSPAMENSTDYNIQPGMDCQNVEQCLEWQTQHEKEHPNTVYKCIFGFYNPMTQRSSNHVNHLQRARCPGIISPNTELPFEEKYSFYILMSQTRGVRSCLNSEREIEWMLNFRELYRTTGLETKNNSKVLQEVHGNHLASEVASRSGVVFHLERKLTEGVCGICHQQCQVCDDGYCTQCFQGGPEVDWDNVNKRRDRINFIRRNALEKESEMNYRIVKAEKGAWHNTSNNAQKSLEAQLLAAGTSVDFCRLEAYKHLVQSPPVRAAHDGPIDFELFCSKIPSKSELEPLVRRIEKETFTKIETPETVFEVLFPDESDCPGIAEWKNIGPTKAQFEETEKRVGRQTDFGPLSRTLVNMSEFQNNIFAPPGLSKRVSVPHNDDTFKKFYSMTLPNDKTVGETIKGIYKYGFSCCHEVVAKLYRKIRLKNLVAEKTMTSILNSSKAFHSENTINVYNLLSELCNILSKGKITVEDGILNLIGMKFTSEDIERFSENWDKMEKLMSYAGMNISPYRNKAGVIKPALTVVMHSDAILKKYTFVAFVKDTDIKRILPEFKQATEIPPLVEEFRKVYNEFIKPWRSKAIRGKDLHQRLEKFKDIPELKGAFKTKAKRNINGICKKYLQQICKTYSFSQNGSARKREFSYAVCQPYNAELVKAACSTHQSSEVIKVCATFVQRYLVHRNETGCYMDMLTPLLNRSRSYKSQTTEAYKLFKKFLPTLEPGVREKLVSQFGGENSQLFLAVVNEQFKCMTRGAGLIDENSKSFERTEVIQSGKNVVGYCRSTKTWFQTTEQNWRKYYYNVVMFPPKPDVMSAELNIPENTEVKRKPIPATILKMQVRKADLVPEVKWKPIPATVLVKDLKRHINAGGPNPKRRKIMSAVIDQDDEKVPQNTTPAIVLKRKLSNPSLPQAKRIRVQHKHRRILEQYLEKGWTTVPCKSSWKFAGRPKGSKTSGFPSALSCCLPPDGPYNIHTWQNLDASGVQFLVNAALGCRKENIWNWLIVPCERSDLMVMDFDDYNSGEEIQTLFKTFPIIKQHAPHARTPSGGEHIYLPYLSWYSKSQKVRKIDIQVNGTHVVAAPSTATSKTTGKIGQYEWVREPRECSKEQWEEMRVTLTKNKDTFLKLYPKKMKPKKSNKLVKPVSALAAGQNQEAVTEFKRVFKIAKSEPVSIKVFNDGYSFVPEGHTCIVRNCIRCESRQHTNPGKSCLTVFPRGAIANCYSCKTEKVPSRFDLNQLRKLLFK